ncbi:MAG: TatD family hydrolase [Gammaproteobacteria bacterium]|nr:TatD family hydrolase [Gammaproteobacteria bacterium]
MELVDICFNFTSDTFRNDEAQVVERARQAGVRHFVITGSSVADSEHAIRLCAQYEDASATAGIHPHLAREFSDESLHRLQQIAAHEKVSAIGETGLDYNRNYSSPAQQKAAFQAQLELAAELALPGFLHQRDAHADFARILTRIRDRLTRVVTHCFTGSANELDCYIDLDCHIGITGWICDERRGRHLHEIIPRIPANRLMIETDAPYLLPRNLPADATFPKPRGRRNEPAYLPHILRTVADCRGISETQAAMETTRTAKDFFSIG